MGCLLQLLVVPELLLIGLFFVGAVGYRYPRTVGIAIVAAILAMTVHWWRHRHNPPPLTRFRPISLVSSQRSRWMTYAVLVLVIGGGVAWIVMMAMAPR